MIINCGSVAKIRRINAVSRPLLTSLRTPQSRTTATP
jgi:hypothetical protein